MLLRRLARRLIDLARICLGGRRSLSFILHPIVAAIRYDISRSSRSLTLTKDFVFVCVCRVSSAHHNIVLLAHGSVHGVSTVQRIHSKSVTT